MTHKVSAAILAASVCFILVPNVFPITAFETTVAEIVKNPDKFNQGQVIVQGKAVQIQQKTTQQGSPYTSFSLLDANTGDKIAVEYLQGTLDLKESTLVTVQGDFYKKPTKAGFVNVIQAILVQE